MNSSAKIIGIVLRVTITLLIVVGIKTYLVQAFRMSSDSMAPTLVKGDRLFVDKRIYRRLQPQRGDIVVYLPPAKSGRKYLQRIVGLPTETIEIKGGMIFINGVSLEGLPYQNIHYQNTGNYAKVGQSVKIPSDSYFILGDNSPSSMDSRYLGFIPRKNILGKVTRIYYPFNRFGPVK